MYKYDIDDELSDSTGRKGTIINRWVNIDGDHIYQLVFEPTNTERAKYEVLKEDIVGKYTLESRSTYSYGGLGGKYCCPKCSAKWTETEHPVHGKKIIWYDCKKCNKTKEQILKEIEEEKATKNKKEDKKDDKEDGEYTIPWPSYF